MYPRRFRQMQLNPYFISDLPATHKVLLVLAVFWVGALMYAAYVDDALVPGEVQLGQSEVTSYEDYGDLMLSDESSNQLLPSPEHADTEPLATDHVVRHYDVKRGDTFTRVANRILGLNYHEAMSILTLLPDPRVLTHWRAGDSFEYQLDDDERLLRLVIMNSTGRGIQIAPDTADGFEIAAIEIEATPQLLQITGRVNGAFIVAATQAGLSHRLATALVAELSHQIDFRRDVRAGDRFHVLVEGSYLQGDTIQNKVVAVRYDGSIKSLIALRNSHDGRLYTPEGVSVEPAFERFPFAGSYRISSGYNLARLHPITRRVAPHRGTDFAMPTGTPILAPSDGRVVRTGHDKNAGKFLVVEHPNGYQTRYLHLERILVQPGSRVVKGQRMALSGNTGRSTGPHLHYEVLVGNEHVDPMKLALPENHALQGVALATFQRSHQLNLAIFTETPGNLVALPPSRVDL